MFYTFQLYFNFSGYSEVARAVGLLLGLELPENFKTPFFATNFSGFWSRWHISFSSWLQDYLFMPLAWADMSGVTGGRLTRLPAEVCVFTVFFVSGFWHGNTLPFVVWGLLQACYRLGITVMEKPFTVDFLRDADEIIVTSSSNFCLHACEFEDKPAGGKDPATLKAIQDEVLKEFYDYTGCESLWG